MKTSKDIGSFIVRIIILLFIIGLVEQGLSHVITSSPEPTAASIATTGRNSFISGCKGQETTEEACGCAYDKLLAQYPDLNTNSDRIHRIITQGYSQSETDLISPCFVTSTLQST